MSEQAELISEYKKNLDLAYLQRHLGRSYNVFLMILKKDGYERYISYIKENAGVQIAEEIKKLIDDFDVEIDWHSQFKRQDVQRLFRWIYPLQKEFWSQDEQNLLDKFKKLPKDETQYSEVDKLIKDKADRLLLTQKQHAIKINEIIYFVMPDGVNAILLELKNEFPIMNILHQLHLLKLILVHNKSQSVQDTVMRHVIGYSDYAVGLMDASDLNFIPVITMVNKIDDYAKENEEFHIAISIEDHLYQFVSKLEKFSEKDLLFENNLFTVSRLTAYFQIYDENLHQICTYVRRSFEIITKIREKQTDVFDELGYSGKRKLIESIPFIISSKVNDIFSILTANLCSSTQLSIDKVKLSTDNLIHNFPLLFKEYVESQEKHGFIKYTRFDNSLNLLTEFIEKLEDQLARQIVIKIMIPIAKRNLPEQEIHILEVKIQKSLNYKQCLDEEVNYNDFVILKGSPKYKNEKLWIEISDSESFVESNVILLKIEKQLNYYFNKTKRDNHSRMMHRSSIFFDVIKGSFEKDDLSNRDEKYKILVKNALHLVMASFAQYFNYDSIKDVLEVRKSLTSAYCLRGVSQDGDIEGKIGHLAKVEDKIGELLRKWGNDKVLRKESAAYICLDKIYPVWTYQQQGGYGPASKMGVFFAQIKRNDLLGLKVDEIDEKDRIVVPVMCHNRIMGVLYISSIIQDQFSNIDRIRILNFVDSFSTEIFKAKLLFTIHQFDILFEDAIKFPHVHEEDFFDKVAIATAKLFGAIGSVLIWKTPGSNEQFRVLGRGGQEITSFFGTEGFFSSKNEFFKELNFHKQTVFVDLSIINDNPGKDIFKILELSSCIQVPIFIREKEIIGVLILFDRHKVNTLSKSLEEELAFVSQEIKQVISNYFDHEGRIRTLNNMLGHDINSSLKAISNRKDELSALSRYIIDPIKKSKHELKLNDISTHVNTANAMVNFIIKEIQLSDESVRTPEYIRIYTDNLKLLYRSSRNKSRRDSQKSNFNYLLNNVLQSYKSRFADKRITFEKPRFLIPDLWINYPILEAILINLVDNVAKYGEYNSRYIIKEYKSPYGEWIIDFISFGIPLRLDIKDDVDLIFAKDIRCFRSDPTDPRTKVKGKGIGMYTSREYISNYGGSLELNDYEEFTIFAKYTFRLRIPFFLAGEDCPWIV